MTSGDQEQVASLPSAGPIRRFLRVTLRFAAVALCVVLCLLEYLLNALTGKSAPQYRPYPLQRWSARLLRWLNVRIQCQGAPPSAGLIVSNHLSYLDILVFSAVAGCAFVSKQEVRSMPGVGWIATLAGTVYIDRDSRSATHSVRPLIAGSLAAGIPLVLFPEGTSSDGRQVLRFRSSLLQPAVQNGIPITAACIAYAREDGAPATDVCFYGEMTMLAHAVRLFARREVRAIVRFADRARLFSDRKAAAHALHEQVSRLLLKTIPAGEAKGASPES